MVLQSGALASAVITLAQARHIGLSLLVSMGNEALISATDAIDYLIEDDETRVIADNASGSPQSVTLSGTGVLGMPNGGSDPNAQPPANNILQEPLGWIALILAVVAAAGIGTEFFSGRQRRSRTR